MALTREEDRPGLTPATEWNSRLREMANRDKDDIAPPLTDEEEKELAVARYCRKLLAAGVKAREPYETFDDCWKAYIGDLWPANMPGWKAKITVNKVRAFIHFMQAVMTDNKPRISVEPVLPGTENASDLLGKLSDRHWDRNDLQNLNALAVLYGLIWGTGIVKTTYAPGVYGGRGKHLDEAIPPYRIWVNDGAKSVEDARFIIHIESMPLGWIYENFPAKARIVKRFRGEKIGRDSKDGGEARDFINEGQSTSSKEGVISPLTMDGVTTLQMPRDTVRDRLHDDDQEKIEVGEFWFRDESEEVYERHKIRDGNPVMEDVTDEDGLPTLVATGGFNTEISPLDGMPFAMPAYKVQQRPVMEKALRRKFPNGRLVLMAGPVVLQDIPNPFQIDGFPFAEWKDQDVGVFWGQGEPPQLKQMNIAIQRIAAKIYDNLNLTGDTSYLVQKDSGLNYKTWKNKPGSLLPVDDITKALQKVEQGSIPQGAMELLGFLKGGMSEIAGINDALIGGTAPSNTAFATIDQLQESSAAILRLKVRNFEKMLKRQGKIRIQLIQQFDQGEEPIRLEYDKSANEPWIPIHEHDENGEPTGRVVAVVPPAADTEVQFRHYKNPDLQGQIEFNIIPDSSLSTSPAGVWNRYMTMLDKKLIDPVSWHEKMRIENWRTIVQRLMAMQSAQASKPGPKGRQQRTQPRPPTPQSHVPSREANAIVR